ncbi:hypothetical protein SteCoe_15684 [Stentor coeruleus]|uniref:Uncharacterized protein n=1 Tax=Stentor coeruleus TaxID=5963 RepID=A0A1R2C303_9CILI|nr:hypothetical protein SteCoe_15684 [Stentor coeruleus]
MCHLNKSNTSDSNTHFDATDESFLTIYKSQMQNLCDSQNGLMAQALISLFTNQMKTLKELESLVKAISEVGNTLIRKPSFEICEEEKEKKGNLPLYTVIDDDWIFNDETRYLLELKVVQGVPKPVFKNKAFSIEIKIVDMEGNEKHLSEPVLFKVMLFTNEDHPNLITCNSSGERILRGKLEVESQFHILFRKILLKEVSSHTPSGYFCLVILPENSENIKPLVIRNVKVKSQVRNNNGTKKPKTRESDNKPEIS